MDESRVPTENLAIKRLKQECIWAQPGKSCGASDVDVVAMGLVWIEVKYSQLGNHRGNQSFRFDTTRRQQKRGFLADIVLLICQWNTVRTTYHLFRAQSPVFYMGERVKTAFTYTPVRKKADAHGAIRRTMTDEMMVAAQNNWKLIDETYQELRALLPTVSDPHRANTRIYRDA